MTDTCVSCRQPSQMIVKAIGVGYLLLSTIKKFFFWRSSTCPTPARRTPVTVSYRAHSDGLRAFQYKVLSYLPRPLWQRASFFPFEPSRWSLGDRKSWNLALPPRFNKSFNSTSKQCPACTKTLKVNVGVSLTRATWYTMATPGDDHSEQSFFFPEFIAVRFNQHKPNFSDAMVCL